MALPFDCCGFIPGSVRGILAAGTSDPYVKGILGRSKFTTDVSAPPPILPVLKRFLKLPLPWTPVEHRLQGLG